MKNHHQYSTKQVSSSLTMFILLVALLISSSCHGLIIPSPSSYDNNLLSNKKHPPGGGAIIVTGRRRRRRSSSDLLRLSLFNPNKSRSKGETTKVEEKRPGDPSRTTNKKKKMKNGTISFPWTTKDQRKDGATSRSSKSNKTKTTSSSTSVLLPLRPMKVNPIDDLVTKKNKDDNNRMMDIEEKEREIALSLSQAEISLEKVLVPTLGVLLVAAGAVGVTYTTGSGSSSLADLSSILIDTTTTFVHEFSSNPSRYIESTLDGMGPLGVVYFGILYVVAELLAIPATPLTLSAGYLFGLSEGITVVLAAGTLSAMIGFVIGKTFLRGWVENLLEENPKFKKLDSAIGSEGFKLLCLVRLSPIFPFALINYTYGASSISFPTFVVGTLLGFTPSTIGYVYTGLAGKELLSGDAASQQPWYIYVAGLSVLFGFLKVVTDVATEIVEAIEDDPNESS